MDDIIYLVSEQYTFDDIGCQIVTPTEIEVFAKINSISQAEFFNASQTGLKAELKAVIWNEEYNGEKKVKYNGVYYSIYRTYISGDKIELYLTERLGNNGN